MQDETSRIIECLTPRMNTRLLLKFCSFGKHSINKNTHKLACFISNDCHVLSVLEGFCKVKSKTLMSLMIIMQVHYDRYHHCRPCSFYFVTSVFSFKYAFYCISCSHSFAFILSLFSFIFCTKYVLFATKTIVL